MNISHFFYFFALKILLFEDEYVIISRLEKVIKMQKIINIAVIAHVDAGKSTLVDAFINQSGCTPNS